MQLNYAHLCDYAMVANDKLSVIGIFSAIWTHRFPAVHPMAFVAFELGFASAELGRPSGVEIKVRDADGGELAAVQLKIDSQGPARPGTTHEFRAVVPLMNLRFEKAGEYELAFFLNGRYDRSISLQVGQVPQPPGATS